MFTDPAPQTQAPDAETAAVRKFMFERSFDDASVVHRAQERKPVLMKPEQIDALKKESFDLGFESGQKAGKDEQSAQLATLVMTVDRNMTALIENIAALTHEQDQQTRRLVLAIAKKIVPDLAARSGLQEIEALLSDTIREMAREPRLVVRIHESQFDAVNERVQAIAVQRAYAGKVIVLADNEVTSGDCRVEWADGGIERNTQATLAKIEQTILPSS